MIAGIDIGTQSLKVVITSDELEILGQASSPYQPHFPEPGWAEQDPALWESAIGPTIAKALKAAGAKPQDISAIGLGGQLDGCIPVVGPGATAARPCIIWMDRRAQQQISGLSASDVMQRTGVNLDATHPAAKIKWLKENSPRQHKPVRYHVPVSYMVLRLTGRHVWDHAHASTSMLYSLKNKFYDPWLLDLFGIDERELPEIANAYDIAGPLSAEGARLTGLQKGTPVAFGTGDDFSTPLGAGMCQTGRVVSVLGTAEVVGALHDKLKIDKGGLVETHAYSDHLYFIENPGWLSGGALEWFRNTFRINDFAELDELAKKAPPGSGGVTFLPGLTGTMAPEWVSSARGCFYGMTPAHDNSHMARAMLEGTAFAMRDVIERLGEMGVETNSILLLGGGAKSKIWAQIRADMTGLPVEIPKVVDTAPVGSAILAAVAAGLQPDLTTATEKVGKSSMTIAPNPLIKPNYDQAYQRYRDLFSCLTPLF